MARTLRLACGLLCVAALMAAAAAQTKDPAAPKKSRPAAAQKPRAPVITGATL